MAHFYLLQIIQLYLEFIVIQMLKTLAEGVGCGYRPTNLRKAPQTLTFTQFNSIGSGCRK